MSTPVNLKPRGQDRRVLTNPDRAILLRLEEFAHQLGARSDGREWIPVPKPVLQDAVALIRRLRRVDTEEEET